MVIGIGVVVVHRYSKRRALSLLLLLLLLLPEERRELLEARGPESAHDVRQLPGQEARP